jgi:hypothetical protein
MVIPDPGGPEVRRLPHVWLLIVALMLATLAPLSLTGCGPKGPTWVEDGGTYTTGSLTTLYGAADISKLSSKPSTDAIKLRHDALTGLRQRGGSAAAAADLITKTLPSSTRGVPVYVEKATVAGQPATIVIEATGPPKGKLDHKQLWALSESGAVIFFGTP